MDHPETDMATPTRDALWIGSVYYYATGLIVLLAYIVGNDFFIDSPVRGHTFYKDRLSFSNWDGQWYRQIADEGYSYTSSAHSNVAFFPAFPLLGSLVRRATGMNSGLALLAVSNAALLVCFTILYKYANEVYAGDARAAQFALAAFGLFPTTFFFRMAYSESVFFLVLLLFLYGARRRWPLWGLAALTGLATACRPVGVALVPALFCVAWQRSGRLAPFLKTAAWLAPTSIWGLAAYMLHLSVRFGDPFVFVRTQQNWRERIPLSLGSKLYALATLEPVTALFNPDLRSYWATFEPGHFPLLSLHVADPFLFLAAVALVVLGYRRGWINGIEALVSMLVILIPYYTIGYETCMRSMGRYCSAAAPLYVVLGRLAWRVPGPMLSCLAAISGFMLGVYTAMFAGWRVFV